jgi:hypothetical protein
MWKIHGGYSFHALDCGVVRATGLDVMEATPGFLAENARRGNPIRFVRGDVNAPDVVERVGTAEVLFCGGVLYHVPNPLLTLERLRALSTGTLILSSVTVPEREAPQAAVFVPFLDAATRARLTGTIPGRKIGLDTEFESATDYANWFWLFTPSCVEAMLRLVGFDVVERHVFGRAACFVCTAGSRS